MYILCIFFMYVYLCIFICIHNMYLLDIRVHVCVFVYIHICTLISNKYMLCIQTMFLLHQWSGLM